MQAPSDKTIHFTFRSHPLKRPELCWIATLTFPPGAVAETRLPLVVTDGNGRPVAEGLFELAGQEVKIADGRGEMTYAAFVAGKHEPSLWLHRPGTEPVSGGLTFA